MNHHDLKELDTVVLTEDFPDEALLGDMIGTVSISDTTEYGLSIGSQGTVVHIWGEHEAFEVEFLYASGYTKTIMTLQPNQIDRP